jgi:hypothetical protein
MTGTELAWQSLYCVVRRLNSRKLTVQSNNAEDEDQRQNQNNHRIDLQTGGLIGVQSYLTLALIASLKSSLATQCA